MIQMKYILWLVTSSVALVSLPPAFGQKKQIERLAGGLVRKEYIVDESTQQRHGMYVEYFNRVKLAEGQYANGKRSGQWCFYDYDGIITYAGHYVEDEQDGLWVYRNNGFILSEVYYNWGEVDSVKGYYEDGVLAYELYYEGNAAENTGLSTSYWPNGQVMARLPIRNSRLDGVCKLYFDNGQLHRSTEYRAGKPFTVLETYAWNGQPCDGGKLLAGNGYYTSYYPPQAVDFHAMHVSAMSIYQEGKPVRMREFDLKGAMVREYPIENDMRLIPYNIIGQRGDTLLSRIDTVPYVDFNRNQTVGMKMPLLYVGQGEMMWLPTLPPGFPGGEKGNYMYRKKAKPIKKLYNQDVYDEVYVCYQVTLLGEITQIQVLRCRHQISKDEVGKAVEGYPRWRPGFVFGVPAVVATIEPYYFHVTPEALKYAIWDAAIHGNLHYKKD